MQTKLSWVMLLIIMMLNLTAKESKATIIAINDPVYNKPVNGVGVIQDTTTNFEWLNIGYSSAPYNYNELLSWLSPGGKLDGWKIASSAQVITLLQNASLPSTGSGFLDTYGNYSTEMYTFQNFIGFWSTYTNSSQYNYTWGIVSDSLLPGQILSILIDQEITTYNGNPTPHDTVNSMKTIPLNDPILWDTPVGAWLVRPGDYNQVPEPSMLHLIILCFISIFFWRYKYSCSVAPHNSKNN